MQICLHQKEVKTLSHTAKTQKQTTTNKMWRTIWRMPRCGGPFGECQDQHLLLWFWWIRGIKEGRLRKKNKTNQVTIIHPDSTDLEEIQKAKAQKKPLQKRAQNQLWGVFFSWPQTSMFSVSAIATHQCPPCTIMGSSLSRVSKTQGVLRENWDQRELWTQQCKGSPNPHRLTLTVRSLWPCTRLYTWAATPHRSREGPPGIQACWLPPSRHQEPRALRQ